MKKRTTRPEKGNKFYITTDRGGWSQCIEGYPRDAWCDVLSNCVGYACGRFNEIIGSMKYPTLYCNAENFVTRAKQLGLKISTTPTLGGIMVWSKGRVGYSADGAGHVCIVEDILDANTIYTSESDYGGKAFYNATRRNSNGRWGLGSGYTFLGCIVNPAVKETKSAENKKSIEEIAKEVLAGKWGNGDDRKNRLTKAGYNYDQIQNKVNELSNLSKSLSKKSVTEIAKEVLAGKWGNGDDRKNRLTKAGYNYDQIQNKVNELSQASQAVYYTVHAGDTLIGIANKFGTTWQKLQQLNNIQNANYINIGQKIRIK